MRIVGNSFPVSTMRRGAVVAIVVLGVLVPAPLMAQQGASGSTLPTASVTFALEFPHSNPERYSIAVDANGHARYECVGQAAQDAEQEAYRTEFEVSAANRQRIFDWTKQAAYFTRKVDSGNHKVAFTGNKTLSYQSGERSTTATYNYSNLEPVRQLTELFQTISATLEYGHRLAYYHRYQKLALDDELKQMEAQARSGQLTEIEAVAPVLREIVDDASVMNGVRVRAKELIQMGGAAGN